MDTFLKTLINLSLLFVLSACSYTKIEPPSVAMSLGHKPDTLVIGFVTQAKAPFYEGLEKSLEAIPGIKVVETYSRDELGPHSLFLKGDLNIHRRNNFGEKVSRHLIGFGVNRREVTGLFEIENSSHDTIMSFAANEYYNGGTGLGGLLDLPGLLVSPFVEGIPYFTQTDIISTDTMQRRLGAEVGEQVREWILANMEQ